ncbi:oligosaccharide flippase family protein [Sphingorhabdus sp.]|uniref:oligosaccharide flippase family protein n=1 Tax=Sphingorhabdus sp. TaxID=1902408 RepID=UPI0032B812C1
MNLFAKMRQVRDSSLVQNAFVLTVLQASGNLALLITLPYLTTTLGPHEWGRVAWMQVILGYFVILVDWGFSWHGTAHIAQLRSDIGVRSRAFFSGWAVQWIVTAATIILFVILHNFADFYARFRDFTIWNCLFVISSMLFPGWFPGGLERLREVALVQFAVRAGSVPLVFILVRGTGDGPLVIASLAIAACISGALGLLWIYRNVEIIWEMPTRAEFRKQLIAGGSVLLSRLSMTLYTTIIPTILGVMISATAVGHYMIADRIRSGIVSLLNPIAQALLPRMSYLYKDNKIDAFKLVVKSGFILLPMTAIMGVFIFIFSDLIIDLMGGKDFRESSLILKWFAFLPLISMISNIVGIQILIPNGLSGTYNRILFSTGIFGLVSAIFLIKYSGALGAAITMFISEILIALFLSFYISRNRKAFFG